MTTKANGKNGTAAVKSKPKSKKTKQPENCISDRSIVKRMLDGHRQVPPEIEHGRKEGIWWARNDAEICELENLEAYIANGGLDILARCAYPRSEFYEVIVPHEMRRLDSEAWWFWEMFDEFGEMADDKNFIRAFAEGALSVWLKIKPKVVAATRRVAAVA